MRGPEAEGRPESQKRTPERAVKIQDQARPAMGNRVSVFQNLLHVGGEIERFRKDDEIERPPELRLRPCLSIKVPVRQSSPGRCDLDFRKIDAHDIAIGKQFEEISSATADL